MKSVLVALSAASSVAAQLAVSFPPEFDLANAINSKDPQYTTCAAAENIVEGCVASVGGTDAVLTADPTKLLNCLCCQSGTGVSPYYSVCSTYIMSEAPAYRTQAEAFGEFYSLCGVGATCTAGAGGGSATNPRTSPGNTRTPVPTATGTATGNTRQITATSVDPNQTYPPVCEDMIAIFASCSSKINNFAELPYREQAACYCCRTARGGSVTWTDELDNYGKTCASWAITGEPIQAYPVASTFASFCENFPKACEATATTGSGSSQTGSSNGGNGGSNGGSAKNNDDVTVTVTPTSTNAANGVRVTAGAAIAAGAAFALAL